VARIASGLPVLSVTGCLCIAVSQSTADPVRGFFEVKFFTYAVEPCVAA
jgi:hypothetical protein